MLAKYAMSTQAPEFNDGELVSRPFWVIRRPAVGRLTEMPVKHRAVLTDPRGAT